MLYHSYLLHKTYNMYFSCSNMNQQWCRKKIDTIVAIAISLCSRCRKLFQFRTPRLPFWKFITTFGRHNWRRFWNKDFYHNKFRKNNRFPKNVLKTFNVREQGEANFSIRHPTLRHFSRPIWPAVIRGHVHFRCRLNLWAP